MFRPLKNSFGAIKKSPVPLLVFAAVGIEKITAGKQNWTLHQLQLRWCVIGCVLAVIAIWMFVRFMSVYGSRLNVLQRAILLAITLFNYGAWTGAYIAIDPASQRYFERPYLWVGLFSAMALVITFAFLVVIDLFTIRGMLKSRQ